MAKKCTGGTGWGGHPWDGVGKGSLVPVYETGGAVTRRCFESHPPLPLGPDLQIAGGSCITPISNDFDIMIGLDSGMKITERSFPWVVGEEFLYRITDREAPKHPANFKSMIEWLADQISIGGWSVHVGCVGGHGRTGLVFAALVAHMGITDDAITYVRENYCKKAVESQVQIDFLAKHFGVKKVEPSKPPLKSSWGKSGGKKASKKGVKVVPFNAPGVKNISDTGTPYPSSNNIWGSALNS